MLRWQLDTTGNLMKDLIAFWPLDEPGGQRRDMLGYNPLTDNNTVTSAKGIGGQGRAAKFTAANSEYLEIGDNPQLSLGSDTAFTVTAWVYLDSKTDYMNFVSKWDSPGGSEDIEYVLRYWKDAPNKAFRFSVGNNTSAIELTAGSLGDPTTGRWYFLAGWHDPTNDLVSIQVDNGKVDSASWTGGHVQ